ncbi:MAG: hypothetical protein GXO37_08070 [Chloroflexi bacterium]|nr:hypothetical protein [Chloroflexota bacterium]
MNKRWLWIALIGGVLLLGSCALCLGTGFVSVVLASRPPSEIRMSVRYPEQVTVGETFSIDISIQNLADRPRTLNSIDIYSGLLDGLRIFKVEPRAQKIVPNLFFTSIYFEHPIGPRETLPVRLVMQGHQPGLYQGTVDVCIDTTTRCTSYELLVTVAP